MDITKFLNKNKLQAVFRNTGFMRYVRGLPAGTRSLFVVEDVSGRLQFPGLIDLLRKRNGGDPDFVSLWVFPLTPGNMLRTLFWDGHGYERFETRIEQPASRVFAIETPNGWMGGGTPLLGG